MTPAEFETLVRRLEEQARRDPAGYRTRVLLLALSGNLYLGLMVLLIFALLLAAIASMTYLHAFGVKIAVVIGIFLLIVLKALWIRFEPPSGAELVPRDAPELFGVIEDLRRRLLAPHFHHVLVTEDFNASVALLPRLGVFGWYRHYLLIGLPLAKTLTVEQFKAVLAHEFGHLARGHGSAGNWIYLQRLRWARLMAVLEAVESSGAVLFRPFLRWYAPYFNAYSYPLARANEYEADATSARLTSPGAVASALTATSVIGRFLDERYWPDVLGQAAQQPKPSFAPFAGMGSRVSAELDPRAAAEWIDHAMAVKSTLDDTHPSLKERLQALGQTASLALPGTGEAADRLLGPSLEGVTQALDRRWYESILPEWEQQYERLQEGRRRLTELDRRHAAGEELSFQDAYDRAMFTDTPGGNAESAIAQLSELHARFPRDALVMLSLGKRLLARDDEAGRAHVERSMQVDDRCIVRGCVLLRDYCWRKGLQDEARAWDRRLNERMDLEQAAAREREIVRSTDKFERHGLDAETLGRLQAQLRSIPRLKKAYFVRKRVKLLPERSCYVLGFRIRGFWHSNKDIAEVQEQIQRSVQLPCDTVIISVVGLNYELGGKFRWMRGSRIV